MKDEPVKMISKKEERKLIKEFKEDSVPNMWIEVDDINAIIEKGLLDKDNVSSDYKYPVASIEISGTTFGWYISLLGIPKKGGEGVRLWPVPLNEEKTMNKALWDIFPDGPIKGSWTVNNYPPEKDRITPSDSQDRLLERLEKKWGNYLRRNINEK